RHVQEIVRPRVERRRNQVDDNGLKACLGRLGDGLRVRWWREDSDLVVDGDVDRRRGWNDRVALRKEERPGQGNQDHSRHPLYETYTVHAQSVKPVTIWRRV